MNGDSRDEIMFDPETQIKCLRCGRPFVQKRPIDQYGPKCKRIMAGQTVLLDRYVVPPRKKRNKKTAAEVIEYRDEKGDITAVIV